MKFMLLCCSSETHWSNLPEETRENVMQQYAQWIREQTAAGRYLGGGKLDDSTTALSVQMPDGNYRVTDGPFAESKEQLGGYHLIECANRDEAVRIAQDIPTLPVGGRVEVRPLLHDIPGLAAVIARQ